MTKTENVYETSEFIIAELAKHGVDGLLWHTGGGCTAVMVELDGMGPDDANACILITDGDAQACLTEERRATHVGWIAGYYPDEDSYGYGENVEYVHGGKLMLANGQVNVPLVEARHEDGKPIIGYDGKVIMLPDWPILDWREDAKALAVNVANFVADLRDNRG